MFKNKTYNGEIWAEDGSKHFCVLEKSDEHKIILKTNFSSSIYFLQKVDIIYGGFIGLGHMTFVGNFRVKYSSGVTGYNEFLVKYCFRSEDSQLNIEDLKIVSASYYNNTIANLQRKVGWVDFDENNYQRKGDLNLSAKIGDNDLKEIITECYKNQKSSNVSITIQTKSSIKFKFSEAGSLSDLISNYNIFKNFILLIFGYFEQFENVVLTLQNQSKVDFHYSDVSSLNKPLSLFGFHFSQIENDYLRLLENWFKHEKLRFICSSIIDNIIYRSMNPHKRFLNSYYSLEGWLKFDLKKDKIKFNKDVLALNDDFENVSGIKNKDLLKFYSYCIRHRDYFVHTNSKQKQIFNEIEADEVSSLFDYVLMLKILKQLGASKTLSDLAYSKFSDSYKSSSYEFRKYMNRDGKL